MIKICKKCLIEKNILEFYRHEKMKDGYLNFCKECIKKNVRNYYKKNINIIRIKSIERHKIYLQKKLTNPRYRKYQKERISNYYKKNNLPRNIARTLKKYKPNNCEICKISQDKINVSFYAHHQNYKDPFKVIWLCPSCHYYIHQHKVI